MLFIDRKDSRLILMLLFAALVFPALFVYMTGDIFLSNEEGERFIFAMRGVAIGGYFVMATLSFNTYTTLKRPVNQLHSLLGSTAA